MIIYPDIEISQGKSVNLLSGLMEDPTVYDITPLEAARKFEGEGAEWLHVVDLDKVFGTGQGNTEAIQEIISSVQIPVQVAGGIRTLHEVNAWFDRGAKRVVLGTVAVTDPSLVVEASNRHPGGIVVSLDTKTGLVMVDGWRTQTSFNALDLARDLQHTGVAAIIHTDIDRAVGNPESNLALTTALGAELSIPVIATGTIKTLDDLARLKYLPNIAGAVTGRALFSGAFTLTEALEIAAQPDTMPETAIDETTASDGLTPQGVRVYLAAFSLAPHVRWWNRELRRAIVEGNPFVEVYLPQEDLRDAVRLSKTDPNDVRALYTNAINDSDVVVALLDGIENEAWTGFECGFARARGKRLIGLLSEERRDQHMLLADVCDTVVHYSHHDDPLQAIAELARDLTAEILAAR